MKLARCVIDQFRGLMSHPSYWGRSYPQLSVIRINISNGNYTDYGDTILVEYGWSDAAVQLKKKGDMLFFLNTVAST